MEARKADPYGPEVIGDLAYSCEEPEELGSGVNSLSLNTDVLVLKVSL